MLAAYPTPSSVKAGFDVDIRHGLLDEMLLDGLVSILVPVVFGDG